MKPFRERHTNLDAEEMAASSIEEVKIGARTFLTHPNLLMNETRGRMAVYAAANITYLTETYAHSVKRVPVHEFEGMVSGTARPTSKKVLIVEMGRWGERAYVLATRELRFLMFDLDGSPTFEEANVEDIIIEWEDEAWRTAATEFYTGLPVDVRTRLCRLSERKRERVLWDAYVDAKRMTRYEPRILWNCAKIDVPVLRGALITCLMQALDREKETCAMTVTRLRLPGSRAAFAT